MKSNNDHSHATNVANFGSFLTYIGTLGTRYNPAPNKQKATYMQSRLDETKTIMNVLITAEAADLEARDRRRDLFESLAPLAVRVVRIFSLCDVSEGTIDTVKSILKKIQGKPLTPAKKTEGEAEGGGTEHESSDHDNSQKSFMFLAQHLRHLIATVSLATDYSPNEIELKIASLETLADNLDAANEETDGTGTALDKARLDRDRALYRDGDGIVKLAKAAKKYISAVFGPTSTESVRANSFTFIDRPFHEVAETYSDPA